MLIGVLGFKCTRSRLLNLVAITPDAAQKWAIAACSCLNTKLPSSRTTSPTSRVVSRMSSQIHSFLAPISPAPALPLLPSLPVITVDTFNFNSGFGIPVLIRFGLETSNVL